MQSRLLVSQTQPVSGSFPEGHTNKPDCHNIIEILLKLESDTQFHDL